jgi:hypothetical protein
MAEFSLCIILTYTLISALNRTIFLRILFSEEIGNVFAVHNVDETLLAQKKKGPFITLTSLHARLSEYRNCPLSFSGCLLFLYLGTDTTSQT